MTEFNNTAKGLNFEDERNVSNSYYRIRSEYGKIGIRLLISLLSILTIVLIHFTVIFPLFLIPDKNAGITGLQPYRFSNTINWTIFCFGTYIIIYIIKRALMRVTPSLKEYMDREINNLGFKIQEKRRSWILFLILNSIAILLLLLMELKVIYFNNNFLNTFFRGILIIYLFVSIILPIVWRFSYDGLTVKLKRNYQVLINPYYRIRKRKVKDFQLINIFMSSNKIAFKFNKYKSALFTNIARTRWLPRKRKSIISKYGLSPFLRFNEFATPSNFQKQFLNIVLALQEWDMQIKKDL
jgi:hypothetical protein